MPVEGEAFLGELAAIDAEGRVTFRALEPKSPSENRTVRLDELVRWGNPVDAAPQTIVVLKDGGQLVTAADWSGGAAVRLDGDEVVVLSNTWGEIRLPRELVAGVVFAQQSHVQERAALVERVRGEPSPGPARLSSPQASARGKGKRADLVLLTNGDRVAGSVTELAGGSLAIATEGGEAKLPLSRVEAVMLGRSRQPSAFSRQPEVMVGMRDGSLLNVDGIEAGDDGVTLKLVEGLKLTGGDVDDIVALQMRGGQVVYLSDLEPADYRHVPYLSVEWPYQRDRNVVGGPIVVGGQRYLKGLGMHSAARLTYRLDGQYRQFDATVAVDDSAGPRGSVTFGVYVLRGGELSQAYTSDIVRGGDAAKPVSVDVSGAEGLTLTVDYADRGDELDRAVWLDARLVK